MFISGCFVIMHVKSVIVSHHGKRRERGRDF